MNSIDETFYCRERNDVEISTLLKDEKEKDKLNAEKVSLILNVNLFLLGDNKECASVRLLSISGHSNSDSGTCARPRQIFQTFERLHNESSISSALHLQIR